MSSSTATPINEIQAFDFMGSLRFFCGARSRVVVLNPKDGAKLRLPAGVLIAFSSVCFLDATFWSIGCRRERHHCPQV